MPPWLAARRLVVAEGGEDVTIKVSDEGGGIPRSGMPSIWTYLYSTVRVRRVVGGGAGLPGVCVGLHGVMLSVRICVKHEVAKQAACAVLGSSPCYADKLQHRQSLPDFECDPAAGSYQHNPA